MAEEATEMKAAAPEVVTANDKSQKVDKKQLSKFDPSVKPETDDPDLIRGQVRFWFAFGLVCSD
jgi:hypothetical protein